ncbi:MAG: MotA/TolQ/ExbB proton channel family protein [Desulfovibrio sp.]|jgi:biopolymer transport protein ExbB|nr:MotA/TolQ/ExbB proton channel family protein [Desulfovibrio sp.]
MELLEHTWGRLLAGGFWMLPILLTGVCMFALVVRYAACIACALRDLKRVENGASRRPEAVWLAELRARYRAWRCGNPDIDAELRAGIEKRYIRNFGTDGRGILLCASLSTLFGLLGTVSGMIASFDAMQTFGAGNTRSMAAGISTALITTQSGLLTGVTGVVCGRFLSRMSARLYGKISAFCRRLESGPAGGGSP